MHKVNFKSIVLLLGLMLPAAWCGAHGTCSSDGLSHIQVIVQGQTPFPLNDRCFVWLGNQSKPDELFYK